MNTERQTHPHLLHQELVNYHAQQNSLYPSLPHSSEQPHQLPEHHHHHHQQQHQPYPPSALTNDQIELDLLEMTNSSQTDSSTKKRRRFDAEERRFLNQMFFHNPKPTLELRIQLAERLDMTPRGIQIWFQNQRSKAKRGITATGTGDDEKDQDSGSSSSLDAHVSDGNPPDYTRTGSSPHMLVTGLSEREHSNSMHMNYTEETREQSSTDEHPPYRTNLTEYMDAREKYMDVRGKTKIYKKQRRRRLNPEETEALLQIFEQTQKPDSAYRQELSERLNLPAQVIEIWFQNQRAKRKRRSILSGQHSHGGGESPICVNATGEEYEYREVAVNSSNASSSGTAVSMSLQPYSELRHDSSSTLNDHMPYTDQIATTSEPGPSVTGSNYNVASGTHENSYKRKSSNSRQRSRAVSHDGNTSDQPQQRRRMTKEEICILSSVFAQTRMPTIDTREDLAKQFDRTPRSIQIWFQNQRSKLKRGVVTLESYRRIGEGMLRRDVNNTEADEGDGSDGDGEWVDAVGHLPPAAPEPYLIPDTRVRQPNADSLQDLANGAAEAMHAPLPYTNPLEDLMSATISNIASHASNT